MEIVIKEGWIKEYLFHIPDELARELEALDTRILTGKDTTEVKEKFAAKVKELLIHGAEAQAKATPILEARTAFKVERGSKQVWMFL